MDQVIVVQGEERVGGLKQLLDSSIDYKLEDGVDLIFCFSVHAFLVKSVEPAMLHFHVARPEPSSCGQPPLDHFFIMIVHYGDVATVGIGKLCIRSD